MVVKIATAYLKTASDAQVVIITRSGISGVGNNTNIFATPVPALTVLTTGCDDFVTAIEDANNGGPAQTAIKNSKRGALVTLMQQFSSYVTITANGDMAVLKLSGLPTQKPTRTRIGPLDAPYGPVLTLGPVTGSLNAVTAPVYGASTYNWRVALASTPNVYVQTAQTTGARAQFTGLTRGQIYNVELNAVGAAGTSDWSDDSSLMVV